MPFNVISLTCTLYAFLIGSLMNLLVRKGGSQVKAALDPSKAEPGGLLSRLKDKLMKRTKAVAEDRGTGELQ